MAPWKTSTAGSARSTSTNSNRRQACLEAALRGGFLIPRLFPPRRAISFGTVRDRFTLRASLPLRPTSFAMRSLGGVRFKIEKKRTPKPCSIARSGWKRLYSKPISAFEFVPDECQHLFILETLPRKAHANTKSPNEITPSLMVSKLYVFQQRVKEHAAERRPGNKKRATPVGWLCNRLRVCESYLSHVLGSTVWPALAMLRNSEAAVNITSEAEFKAVSQES